MQLLKTSFHFHPFLLILLFTVYYIPNAICFSRGAPTSACETLTPSHGRPTAIEPQNPKSFPYLIEVDSTHYKLVDDNDHRNKPITIKLIGSDEEPFKGFLVMGHLHQPNGYNVQKLEPVGELKEHLNYPTTGNAIYANCSGNNKHAGVMTHKNAQEKKLVLLEWTPPEQDGDYVILATMVKNYNTFWVKEESNVIKIRHNDDIGPGLEPIPVKPMNNDALVPIHSRIYQNCGPTTTQKGCFGLPRDCVKSNSCEMLVTFHQDRRDNIKSDLIRFELSGIIPQNSEVGHVSVGFSTDQKMGNDSVIGCVLQNGKVHTKRYYNFGNKQNVILDTEQNGLVFDHGKELGNFVNGFVYCEFKLKPVQTDLLELIGEEFDLVRNSYFIFLARANSMGIYKKTGAEQLGYHGVDGRGISPDKIRVGEYKGELPPKENGKPGIVGNSGSHSDGVNLVSFTMIVLALPFLFIIRLY